MAKVKTMRVRMVRMRIVQNGNELHTYGRGNVYELPEVLAQVFIAHGDAVQDKMLDAAPETKAI
jgi:hypothetical protein